MDSLFSLELIINYIKVSHDQVECLFPCVAFRLLDYPTIAISLLDVADAQHLKLKLELNQELNSRLKISHFSDLLDKNGRYIFAKGKSCLFRSNIDVLYGHLKNVPVYLMLLDNYNEPHKLIGTSSVPLNTVMNEIYEELADTSFDAPCTKLMYGVFDFKNLMGHTIGHISLAFRLSSFGTTLLPHIGITDEALERQRVSNHSTKQTNEVKSTVDIKLVKTLQSIQVQTLPVDCKHTTQIEISSNNSVANGSHPAKADKLKAFTTTVNVKRTIVEDEFVFNHYCPPALHYNSNNNDDDLMGTSENRSQYERTRIDYLENLMQAAEVAVDQVDEDVVTMLDDTEETCLSTKEHQNTSTKYLLGQKHNELTSKRQANEMDLGEFPLLKCLFEEISKLTGGLTAVDNIQTQSISYQQARKQNKIKSALKEPMHSKPKEDTSRKQVSLVGILKDSSKTVFQRKIDKEVLIESVARLSQPRTITPRKVDLEHQSSQAAKKLEQDDKRKKKLKYGLTNTHRMRVLLNRPNKVENINEEHLKLSQSLQSNLNQIVQNKFTVSELNTNKQTEPYHQTQVSVSNSTGRSHSRSPMNLSLLNKVEMESTIDYAINRQLFAKSANLDDSGHDERMPNPKFVQFGDTYIMNKPIVLDDSPSSAITPTSTTITSDKLKPTSKNETNFMGKDEYNAYAFDFESNSTISKQTNDNDENSLKISQIRLNSDYIDQILASTSTKYSNENFLASTKSVDDDCFLSSKDTQ